MPRSNVVPLKVSPKWPAWPFSVSMRSHGFLTGQGLGFRAYKNTPQKRRKGKADANYLQCLSFSATIHMMLAGMLPYGGRRQTRQMVGFTGLKG